MANIANSLQAVMAIEGAQAVALADYDSGMLLAQAGTGIDMDVAVAGNTRVIRAKLRTMQKLALDDELEDILISLADAYHVLRPIASRKGLFFYVVLDRRKANLAMARRTVFEVEKTLRF